MSEENKALVRRVIEEAWNKGNLAVIDELLSPDYAVEVASPGSPGREGYRQAVTMFRAAFPDLRFSIADMVAEGDKVVVRATIRGTHKGEYLGIGPTGKQVTLTAISIRRLQGGKIVEEWVEADMMGLMQQMGVVPPPGQGG